MNIAYVKLYFLKLESHTISRMISLHAAMPALMHARCIKAGIAAYVHVLSEARWHVWFLFLLGRFYHRVVSRKSQEIDQS